MKLTARDSGYYTVYADGVAQSPQHASEREAIEHADALGGPNVYYEHAYVVDYTPSGTDDTALAALVFDPDIRELSVGDVVPLGVTGHYSDGSAAAIAETDDIYRELVTVLSTLGTVEGSTFTAQTPGNVVVYTRLNDTSQTLRINIGPAPVEPPDVPPEDNSADPPVTQPPAPTPEFVDQFDGKTVLGAATDFTLDGSSGRPWVFGSICQYSDVNNMGAGPISVTDDSDQQHYMAQSYRHGGWYRTFLDTGFSSEARVINDKLAGQPIIWIVCRHRGDKHITSYVCPLTADSMDAISSDTATRPDALKVDNIILGQYNTTRSQSFFRGGIDDAFFFDDRDITKEDILEIAQTNSADVLGTALHRYKPAESLKDLGSGGVDLAVPVAPEIPEEDIPGMYNDGGFGDPSRFSERRVFNPDATGPSITLDGYIISQIPYRNGGTSSKNTHISLTAQPGTRVRAKDDGGRLMPISLRHHSDGSYRPENWYGDVLRDVDFQGKIVLNTDPPQTLYEGRDTLYARAGHAIRFYKEPEVLSNWQNSPAVPKIDFGGENANFYDQFMRSDHGVNGIGLETAGMGNTGDHSGLGIWSKYECAMVTNPNAENAEVVKLSGCAASTWHHHCLDPNTNDLPDPEKYRISYLSASLGNGNVVQHEPVSRIPRSLSQAAAHAPPFGIAASTVFGSEAFREEIDQWAYYIAFNWENPDYRYGSTAGPTAWHVGQARGWGWSQRELAAAAYFSIDHPQMFKTWLSQRAEDMAHQLQKSHDNNELPIFKDILYAIGGGHDGIAWWQQDFCALGLGYTKQLGHDGYDQCLELYSPMFVQRMLQVPYELASTYKVVARKNGVIAKDVRQCYQFDADLTGSFTDALALDESKDGTQEMFDALRTSGRYSGHRVGDLSDPRGTGGYAAIYKSALSFFARYKCTGAEAAWDKLQPVYREPHTSDTRFNLAR